MQITKSKMSNRPSKQPKLNISFSVRKQIVSVRVKDDVEVLQPPSTSNTTGVVSENLKE